LETTQRWTRSDPYLAHLRQRFTKGQLRFVSWLPERSNTPESHAAIRRVRLHRVMIGYASAWIDLRPPVATTESTLSGPWHNQLKRAEKEKLSIRASSDCQNIDVMLSRHDENRKRRGFGGPNGRFIRALIEGTADRQDALVVTACHKRESVAGVLLFAAARAQPTTRDGQPKKDAPFILKMRCRGAA